MMRRFGASLSLIFLLAGLSGCAGTLEVGIERTPAPTPSATEAPNPLQPTLEALQAENNRLVAALQAVERTPTPEPPNLGRVAYVQGGDIWTKALPDGKPTRLTSDGRNGEPRWSPSGQRLAFRKDRTVVLEDSCEVPKPQRDLCRQSVWQRQLWVADVERGGLRQLNQGFTVQDFSWSPAEERIAYVDTGGRLHVAEGNGERDVVLYGGAGMGSVGAISWSPDGGAIGFEYTRQTPGMTAPEYGLWRITSDGRTAWPVYVAAVEQDPPRLASWSSTGRVLLLWLPESLGTGGRLSAVHAETGPPTDVAPPPLLADATLLLQRGFIVPAPAGSAAGAAGTVAVVLGGASATWQDKRVAVVAAAAGAAAEGRSDPSSVHQLSTSNQAALSPAWSPDGRFLAYSAMPDHPALELGEPALPELMQRRIWVHPLAGGDAVQVTHDNDYRDEFPQWTRDGRYLLFARLEADGRASLWVMPAAGGAPLQVVDEITPAPDPLGAFGLIAWPQFFDWTRGAPTS